jgi:hypothetical protein
MMLDCELEAASNLESALCRWMYFCPGRSPVSD